MYNKKLKNGLHPRAYVAAYNYLRPLSDLIRTMDGPIHRRELIGGAFPALTFGNRLQITYSIPGRCYRVRDLRFKLEKINIYDTSIEILLALPYILYCDIPF